MIEVTSLGDTTIMPVTYVWFVVSALWVKEG